MTGVWVVARRELSAYFHTPIAFALGVLFLFVQGFSFWAVLEVLSDPHQRAPYGAVLESHFGGTFLYWAMLFLMVAVISMRLVAEEKRQGTWETLLTTPLSDAAVLVGKWVAALAFYLVLWIPTLLYVAVLGGYSPPGASPDPGPVMAAYLGVAVQGGAFLAIGLVMSSATSNQIIAAVATFVALMAMLLAGEARELVPGWLDDAPGVASVLERLDPRLHLRTLASGAIDTAVLVFYAAITAGALCLAVAVVAVGRRRRAEVQGRFVAALLVVAIAGLTSVLGWRHSRTWDVTRTEVHTLTGATERVLAAVNQPVDVLVIRPGLESFEPIYDQLDRLLARLVEAQPLLRRRDLDPALEPERARAYAAEHAVAIDEWIDGGAVVLQVGERSRAVDILDMATFDRDDLGVGRMASFRAEDALASALADLTDADRPILCATSGHGELSLGPSEGRAPSWASVARRAQRDGAQIEDVGRVPVVPPYCRVLVVAGPRIPLDPDEALAVADYLNAGGALLLAARTEVSADTAEPLRLGATGLELVLADYGVGLPPAIAMDPEAEIELPLTWRTLVGYGDHPITRGFRGRRPTVWQRPRVVSLAPTPVSGSAVLIRTSSSGWGERSLETVFANPGADPGDLDGPVAIAVAAWSDLAGEGARARLVVIGSALSLSTELAAGALGANEAFAAAALDWLSRRAHAAGVGEKTPEYLRLLMTRGQLRGAFATVVVAIPLLVALFGVVLWRVRRHG